MNILFIGDIVGRPGRELIRKGVRALAEKHEADLVIANAENAAAGFGITKDIGETILEHGVDVMTSGNHIFDKKEAIDYIKANTEKSIEIYREISGDKTSVADLMEMLKQPGMMAFQMAPAGSMKFAEHMHKVGILKTMPKNWTDYFLPASSGLNGS